MAAVLVTGRGCLVADARGLAMDRRPDEDGLRILKIGTGRRLLATF